MGHLRDLYCQSLSLLTDLYQLTMAQGYWKQGIAQRKSVFHLTFRKPPFQGEYAIACGLGDAIDWLDQFELSAAAIEYLGGLTGRDQQPLFEPDFLDELGRIRMQCDVDAIPEGTVVFAHQPLIRLQGPLVQCQLFETALLNIINFQTLIATKAARICQAAAGQSVLEFGLRRAQGVDGAIASSRAAYIGGCDATSNVLAGQLFGIPVRGTHAHSWVMSFDDELQSFLAYARALPNNCVFLVDTYDTLQGVRHAIEVGNQLRRGGHEMVGIRLDSGDLAALSQAARKLLDEAGFEQCVIVASNDLDEYEIDRLRQAGATINVWGVGTRLATAYDQPALGGVYKLSALQDEQGQWQYKVKRSEDPIKVSNPGILQVRRYLGQDQIMRGDVIYSQAEPQHGTSQNGDTRLCHPPQDIPPESEWVDLLQPIFRNGRLVYDSPSIHQTQQQVKQSLKQLPDSIRRFSGATRYPVSLESNLHQLKMSLIASAREIES